MGEKRPPRLMQRPLVGLDIDLSSVRMVRLRRRNEEYVIAGAAVVLVAPWGDDPDLHRVHTIEAVRACFAALGPGKKLAVCGLRGPEVVVRGFEFPTLPPEETQGAVELETAQMCPFSMDDGALDHQVTSDRDGKTRGFWVAANRHLIEDRIQLVRDAGLQCVLMDVDGLALLNCLSISDFGLTTADSCADDDPQYAIGDPQSASGPPPQPVLLDVGDAHASIAVIDQAGRPFVRDLCCGGHEIVREIAREMRATTEEVRDALLSQREAGLVKCESVESRLEAGGCRPKAPTASSLRSAALPSTLQTCLERACGRLVEDVVTTLRYYAAQNRSVRIARMLVCGSFAEAQGFIELLAAKLPIEVTLWNPVGQMARQVQAPGEELLNQAGTALTVAVGLAMRTI
ncbi:MAG: pilus assembly protein PilM [Sedimentisphaerales bacterium]|nr:pilus assembly protein PilM [Sedimentisphaerales bacterium]